MNFSGKYSSVLRGQVPPRLGVGDKVKNVLFG